MYHHSTVGPRFALEDLLQCLWMYVLATGPH